MRLHPPILAVVALFSFAALEGCGFTPLYATSEPGAAPGLQGVYLSRVVSSESATPDIARAFERRTALDDSDADYDLAITVREGAQALAVQIDSSVTRYNYRMSGTYVLTRRSDGRRFTGRGDSVASFNVVSSQYSTLYAEEAAREKAARALVEDMERDILLKLSGAAPQTPADEEPVDDPLTDPLIDPVSGRLSETQDDPLR